VNSNISKNKIWPKKQQPYLKLLGITGKKKTKKKTPF